MSIKDEVLKGLEIVSYCPICMIFWDGYCKECENKDCQKKLKEMNEDTRYYFTLSYTVDYEDAVEKIDLTLAKVREKIKTLFAFKVFLCGECSHILTDEEVAEQCSKCGFSGMPIVTEVVKKRELLAELDAKSEGSK